MFNGFRWFIAILVWLSIPVLLVVSYIIISSYSTPSNYDAFIPQIIISAIAVYAIWLIVIGVYIFPHGKSKNAEIVDYFNLPPYHKIQVVLVVIHIFMYFWVPYALMAGKYTQFVTDNGIPAIPVSATAIIMVHILLKIFTITPKVYRFSKSIFTK